MSVSNMHNRPLQKLLTSRVQVMYSSKLRSLFSQPQNHHSALFAYFRPEERRLSGLVEWGEEERGGRAEWELRKLAFSGGEGEVQHIVTKFTGDVAL